MEVFNEMQVPKITAYAKDGKEQLMISVFNGKVNMTIWPGRDSGQSGVMFKQNLNLDGVALLKTLLKKVSAGQPGTKSSLNFQTYNRDTRKYEPGTVIVFGKDEKQVYFFEFQFKHNGNAKSLRFDMKVPNSMSIGSDIMSDAEKSSARMKAFFTFLEDIAPSAMLLSGKKFKGSYNRSSGNSGGGSSSGGSSGGNFGGDDAF